MLFRSRFQHFSHMHCRRPHRSPCQDASSEPHSHGGIEFDVFMLSPSSASREMPPPQRPKQTLGVWPFQVRQRLQLSLATEADLPARKRRQAKLQCTPCSNCSAHWLGAMGCRKREGIHRHSRERRRKSVCRRAILCVLGVFSFDSLSGHPGHREVNPRPQPATRAAGWERLFNRARKQSIQTAQPFSWPACRN